jgi:creatinine amidohydrolase/Fe(II)-dependent formamide hydrolase-like protein
MLRSASFTALLLMLGIAADSNAQQQRRQPTAQERAEQQRRLEEELAAPRPIDAAKSLWIDELTWMEVRDEIAAGKTTAIISTGGIEQNGPYLITGKHNVILRGACEAVAMKLGNALCAPVIAFVPEGSIEPKSGHMRYPGTISLREETYRSLLDDVASSLQAHGFTEIILIGDSGGNQTGLEATASALNQRWNGKGTAYYIPEFYEYDAVVKYMNEELGIVEPENEGLHDSLWITALMMIVDPASVRYDQRVAAGKATINGSSIVPKEKTIELGQKLLEYRVEQTVKAIQAARAANGS